MPVYPEEEFGRKGILGQAPGRVLLIRMIGLEDYFLDFHKYLACDQ